MRIRRRRKNPFDKIEKRFSLKRTDSEHDSKGVHSKGSYHYRTGIWGTKEARDYGDSLNTHKELFTVGVFFRDLAKKGKKYRGYEIREMFGPFNWYVKNGKVYQGKFPNHGDHVHIALSK